MFQDRSKNYDFKKIDQNARTQTITKENASVSPAHKKLFGAQEEPTKEQKVQQVKQEIITKQKQSQNIWDCFCFIFDYKF